MKFEMITNRQVIFGEEKITELAAILRWHGKRKVMLVSYSHRHEGFQKVSSVLETAGISYFPYEIQGREPDAKTIEKGRDLFLTNEWPQPFHPSLF